jgi:hypothetical protein
MDIDQSLERAKVILNDVTARVAEIETEEDARFHVINRLLIEALGWEYREIRAEPHSDSGYTDYLLSAQDQKRMVIEAKRIGPILINTLNQQYRSYKVGGPALTSALAGITQAVGYCLDHGVNYAVLTTGLVWIAFLPMPAPGKGCREGLALVFPSGAAILDNYATFYDLFSKEDVLAKTYNLRFAKAGGLSVTEFEPLVAANTSEYLRMLSPSGLALDLEPVFRGFFGVLSAETDRDMMLECFVETRESRFADASLEKIVRSVSASIAELSNSADNQLAHEIEQAVSSGYAETIVLVGNNGAGKSLFIERFFDSVLDASVRDCCTVVRIDLLEATGDPERIADWLTGKIRLVLERLTYGKDGPTYEELQGLYFGEYRRWMLGPFKPLYESDKTAFKVKFSEFLDKQLTSDPYTYILRLLEDIVRNRKQRKMAS